MLSSALGWLWHRIQGTAEVPSDVADALQRRSMITQTQQARVLMIQTEFGEPIT